MNYSLFNKFIVLILSFCVLVGYGAEISPQTDEDENYYDFEESIDNDQVILKKKRENDGEVDVSEETLIELYDFEKGYKQGFYDTSEDDLKISFSYQFNSDPRDIAGFSGVETQIGLKSQIFPESWWLAYGELSRANFQEISENNTDTSIGQIPNRTDTQMFIIGLGYGLRYNIFKNFFNSDKLFENINFFINYTSFDEDHASTTYTGYGMKAEYIVNRRVSQSFNYGFKVCYNISSVSRGLEDGESGDKRELTLSWLSFGLNFGFEI